MPSLRVERAACFEGRPGLKLSPGQAKLPQGDLRGFFPSNPPTEKVYIGPGLVELGQETELLNCPLAPNQPSRSSPSPFLLRWGAIGERRSGSKNPDRRPSSPGSSSKEGRGSTIDPPRSGRGSLSWSRDVRPPIWMGGHDQARLVPAPHQKKSPGGGNHRAESQGKGLP